MKRKVRVAIVGAAGKMGTEAARAVLEQDDMTLAGVVDVKRVGEDLGIVLGKVPIGLAITSSLAGLFDRKAVDVMVDFTRAEVARENINLALSRGVRPVVGTTGLAPAELTRIDQRCREAALGAVICPNFSVGAMLLSHFAREGARYFPNCEIVEMHHETKVDVPSGTALRLKTVVDESAGDQLTRPTPVHSVRLPGLVAHHRVIFGGPGETLTLVHDSMSRQSFMPGLLRAIRVVGTLTGLVTDLEIILQMGL